MNNKELWEKRSKLLGDHINSVLCINMPKILNEHFHNWQIKIILSNISINYKNILDMGCGYGRLSMPIIENFPLVRIKGIDISENYIRLFKENTKQDALQCKIEQYPFEQNQFDCILCSTVLMYVKKQNHSLILQKIINSLNDNGKLILIENDYRGKSFMNGFGVINLYKKIFNRSKEISGGYFFKEKEIEDLIRLNNASIIKKYRISLTTIFIIPIVILSKLLNAFAMHKLLNFILNIEFKISKFKLPTIHIAYIIKKQQTNKICIRKVNAETII
jgi:2-polyprenyl-3-methyl-5-hydroxy-6-metoxy-1,4-benzoquinol methylase